MRYLIAIIMILAFTSPSMSACNTTDKELFVGKDCDLPDSITFTPDQDCSMADWSFEFVSIDGQKPSIIITLIDCMDLTVHYVSWIYPPDREPYTFSGDDVEITNTSEGHLHISRLLSCGNFSDMRLKVTNFRQ